MAPKRRPEPLDADTLAVMLEHVAVATWEMAEGEARWLLPGQHDVLAGRASSLAARALIEFLVGRKSGRKAWDICPGDYVPTWTVDADDIRILRDQLQHLDARVAHLSLTRATVEDNRPERWSDTVGRIFRLVRRFADEISDHPAHGRLFPALDNAAARLEDVSPEALRRRLDGGS